MWRILQICLLLAACTWNVAQSTTFKYDPLTRQIARLAVDCTKSGLICTSCTGVAECIDLGGGTFLRQDVYDCEPGSCLESTGNCTTAPNPACDENIKDFKLTCRQVGVFPHPFNRCQYLMCIPGPAEGSVERAAKVLNCPAGFAFDPLTGLCREKLPDATCPMLILPCSTPTQRGVIPNNPSMYYICLKSPTGISLPQLFLCPRDQVYNETKRACEDPPAVLADNTGIDATTGRCTAKGYFYKPTTCLQYTECLAAQGIPYNRLCSSKMYFDKKQSKCVNFTCSMVV